MSFHTFLVQLLSFILIIIINYCESYSIIFLDPKPGVKPEPPPLIPKFTLLEYGFHIRHCVDPDAIPKNTSDWNKLFRSRLFRYNADIADVAGKKFKSPKPRKCHTFIVATADEINWAFLNSNVKIKEMEGTYESRKPFELFHLTLKEDGKYSVANLRPHYVQCTLDENWNPVHYVGAIPTPRNPCLSLLLECIRNLRYLYRI